MFLIQYYKFEVSKLIQIVFFFRFSNFIYFEQKTYMMPLSAGKFSNIIYSFLMHVFGVQFSIIGLFVQ